MRRLASASARAHRTACVPASKWRLRVAVTFLAVAVAAAGASQSEARSKRLGETIVGAPNWYEVLQGVRSRPQGVLMTIHGGGWTASGPQVAKGMRPTAERWRSRGWDVVNLTHRPGAASLDDVVRFYDAIRRQVGKTTPICALGGSSGGNLALLLATRRPVSCVVSVGGPSDLVRLGTRPAAAGSSGWQFAGPRKLKEIARTVLGSGKGLVAFSPRRFARRITARVLLATSAYDPLITCAQDRELADVLRSRRRWVLRLCLPPGKMPFTHAGVSRAGWREYLRGERLVARVANLGRRG